MLRLDPGVGNTRPKTAMVSAADDGADGLGAEVDSPEIRTLWAFGHDDAEPCLRRSATSGPKCRSGACGVDTTA